MKRFCLAASSFLLALLLSGCAIGGHNVNDLLRAPAMGAGRDEIQKALTTWLGEEPQYKYPKERVGEWRSPLVSADLDGDGENEAILLYSVVDGGQASKEKGSSVYMAVLSYKEDGWQVVQDEQGLNTEVASVVVADLLGDGTKQLIIGYATANLNAKTMALYTYADERLTKLYEYDYSRFEVGDFTGRGGSDLIVVSRDDDPGGLTLQYVATEDGRFLLDAPHEPVKLDTNFYSCAGICPSLGPDGSRLLIIDGVTATDTGGLASQIVYYSGERFYTVDDSGALRGATARLNTLLRSRDIDGDGFAEIPLRVGKNVVQTPASDKNLEFVEWMDFTDPDADPAFKQYGLVDSDRGVFISLPAEWRGNIDVVDGAEKGEWRIQSRRSLATLLTLRTVEQNETPPVGSLRVPNSVSSYLVFAGGLSEAERAAITMTALS